MLTNLIINKYYLLKSKYKLTTFNILSCCLFIVGVFFCNLFLSIIYFNIFNLGIITEKILNTIFSKGFIAMTSILFGPIILIGLLSVLLSSIVITILTIFFINFIIYFRLTNYINNFFKIFNQFYLYIKNLLPVYRILTVLILYSLHSNWYIKIFLIFSMLFIQILNLIQIYFLNNPILEYESKNKQSFLYLFQYNFYTKNMFFFTKLFFIRIFFEILIFFLQNIFFIFFFSTHFNLFLNQITRNYNNQILDIFKFYKDCVTIIKLNKFMYLLFNCLFSLEIIVFYFFSDFIYQLSYRNLTTNQQII